jgi:signal peptidase I
MPSTLGKVGSAIFRIVIGREKKKYAHGDPTREVFETVVFVVVLVLMLKLFVAEAFVIPTGSMASSLWGDQVKVECPECGNSFPVASSVQKGVRHKPSTVACQNCGYLFSPSNKEDWSSGDRVLVAKYEYHIRKPQRFDVPVFKYPQEPYNVGEKTAMNYIKRLVGLPGETIAIYKGDLYKTEALKYPGRPRPERDEDLWFREIYGDHQPDYTYTCDPEALADFQAGKFEPIRKSPDEILAVRRLVFDLEEQPKSLQGVNKTRWHPMPSEAGTGWTMDEKGFRHAGGTAGWMRYHHVKPGTWGMGASRTPEQPVEIGDYLAYNSDSPPKYWVPDLLVECKVELADASDRVTLELSKAGDKFQAVFDNGTCRLFRVPQDSPSQPVLMAEQKSGIGKGRYSLRFANFDSRLTVWVDGSALAFGTSADYPPPSRESFGSATSDREEPARIGATGNVVVTKVSLWRDVYYSVNDDIKYQVQTQYVHPGHYYCLGDNSASSLDGRAWGLVPERLLLGRAVVIYWPLSRIRVIK